ncbi:hypothetical protein HXW87_21145 [Pseudomonas sp. Y5-11]|jgi:hypothetical protein|uniref:hypothetical protein n=1 Tax=Pseudomonas sp. Y5-11 TaxID=2749808 RepID=UPI001EFC0444|nr:hypothetical protein [Pseudomonas sp. Y5-11]ULN84585.1 hypothetical protein HXW87_21145 [Pseudomonas sp. Y5-11]
MSDNNLPGNKPIGIHIIGNATDISISDSKFGSGITGILMEERDGLAPSDVRLSNNEFDVRSSDPAQAAEKKKWFREYWLQLSVGVTLAAGGVVWTFLFGG